MNSNQVADRIIDAVRKNEKSVIVPGYLQIMLAVKWLFPWGCISGFLRRLVPDAAPQHQVTEGAPVTKNEDITELPIVADDNSKGSQLLIHRLSTGERVL